MCVYLRNSVSLCCSPEGLVGCSRREGSMLRCVFVYLQLRLLHSHTHTHIYTTHTQTYTVLGVHSARKTVSHKWRDWCDFSVLKGRAVKWSCPDGGLSCFLQCPFFSLIYLRLRCLYMGTHYLPSLALLLVAILSYSQRKETKSHH